MVSILCTSRSGSTNLALYLSKLLNLELDISPFMDSKKKITDLKKNKFYKIMIHQMPSDFDSLFEFGEKIINISDKVILLDRENKLEQSESLAFRKKKYGNLYNEYHIKEPYTDIDNDMVQECMFHFNEHGIALKQLSKKYNIPLFTYESIYYGNRLKDVLKYLKLNENIDIAKKYIDISNKERIINIKESLI